MKSLAIIFVLLNLIDAGLTQYFMTYCYGRELNPLMSHIITEWGWVAFWIIKMTGAAVCAAGLYFNGWIQHRYYKAKSTGTVPLLLLNGVYVYVVLSNVFEIWQWYYC